MPLAVLLNRDDPLFDFEHAMAHRAYLAVMAPLYRFSAAPYFIEPSPLPPGFQRADMWSLDHQQAHDDYSRELPQHWQSATVDFGIPNSQNLVDNDWNDPGVTAWTTFVNHQQHMIANDAILPLPATEPVTPPTSPPWWSELGPATYPFW